MKNKVQLIAYADRLGGTLRGMRELLDGALEGLFGGVHLLPFFDPVDGADAGFDPIDHTCVDSRLGNWNDVAAIAQVTDVMADLIVNHISSRSPQFLDFSALGSQSRFGGMFLTLDHVFPEGVTERDLTQIYRPRPSLPFTPIQLGDGSKRVFWTTFSPEQIDIDVSHPCGTEYLDRILETFATNGVSQVRLDAIGYAIKRAGSTCFMLPETCEFIGEISGRARRLGLEILVELHSYYRRQIEIAGNVDRVYDFALPPLALHTCFTGNTRALKHWIGIRPENAVTVLDTHDGIGVIDVGADADADTRDANPGLISDDEMTSLVQQIHENSRGESRLATGAAASNLDLYQVNCTFYDALGRDDIGYLICRAIQFFVPGVPQVYYVGLLAGSNDMERLATTGVGRDINRHHYAQSEIDAALARPVVARLLDLIRLRNSHPAFDGNFEVVDSPDHALDLRWDNNGEFASLLLDFARHEHRLQYSMSGKRTSFALNTSAIESRGVS